jgi:Na+/melibiose symporter-like transporter
LLHVTATVVWVVSGWTWVTSLMLQVAVRRSPTVAGIGVGAAHVLPWSIIPDAVEWDDLATGQRHEGMFYSLVTLMQKIASSVAIPVVLLMLEVTGYVPNAPAQNPATARGIQTLIGPVAAVLLSAGILFALLYPLSRKRHAEVRAELELRRAEQRRHAAESVPSPSWAEGQGEG